MFPIKKFRIGSDCNFMGAFEDYFKTNYRLEVFNQCQDFIKELSQIRNILSYMSANQSETTLDSLLSKSVSYIKTLLELNSVVNIDSTSLKINFSWREVSKDQTTMSNNLYYEICSIKYNIAVLLMSKGYLHLNSKDKNELKEAYNNFIQAAGLYEEIDSLCNKYYVTKENIPDFSQNLLYTYKNYALGMGQIAIYKISEGQYGPDLLKKLAYGVFQLLNRSLSTTIYISGDRGEIEYLSRYYLVKALNFEKNIYLDTYNNRGSCLGIVLGLEQALLEHLRKLEENKNKYGTLDQQTEVTNLLRNIQSEFEQNKYKNDLVNKESINASEQIENLQSAIKAQVPQNKYTLEVSSFPSLNQVKKSLINPQIKTMIDRYLFEMKKYVDGNVCNYQTPDKIDDFINSRGLHDIFGFYGGETVLSNEVFRNIQEIQAKGGLGGLLQKFKLINNEFHNLQNKINSINTMYNKEEMENQNYLKMYGDKWNLPLDPSYKNKLNSLNEELNNRRKNDISLSNMIMSDKSFYELLKFKEKAEIEAKIPKDMNEVQIQSTPVMKELQKNINLLFDKKNTMLNLLNALYSKINNDWPLDDFNQVLKRLKNEGAVLQEQKDAILNNFKEIEKVNAEILNLYPLIERDYNEYSKQTGFKGNVTNNKYLQFFNNLKTNYQMHSMELNKRLQEYYDFGKRIDVVGNEVNDHIQARNFGKGQLLENLEHEFRMNMAGLNNKK